MKNQNKQIANPQLHLSENCSNLEKEIIKLYWTLQEDEFTNTPKLIKKKYDISQTELTQIASKHASLSFYLFCEQCNSYEKHEAKSQSAFKTTLSEYRSRYNNPFKCDYCKELQRKQRELARRKERETLINKLEKAVTNKNWEQLSNFEKRVLKNSLELDFDDLKKHYFNLLGKAQYIKFIRALENIEQHDLLVLQRDSWRGWIENSQYIQSLYDVKDLIIIKKTTEQSEQQLNTTSNELKLKLTINKERYHPDSPLYAGCITFKEQIIIEPNVEYVFAQWERANDNLYFTLIPTTEFEKLPVQKPISNLPISLQKGITDFLNNLGSNLEF
ncbi:conserved protein of unknown function [Tenacibaculum soleae]|uniref:hypothetical protein n=1 Tax=Tenacibaculum soleae TaxID=447689 RepID=UPI003AB7859C